MNSVENVVLRQSGRGRLSLSFRTPNNVEGFDHAYIIIAEQDVNRDDWEMIESSVTINGLTFSRLWYNRLPDGVRGKEDDIGLRIKIEPINANGTTNININYREDVPDYGGGNTLQFYAVIAIVAVADGEVPISMLGDIYVSPTNTVVPRG